MVSDCVTSCCSRGQVLALGGGGRGVLLTGVASGGGLRWDGRRALSSAVSPLNAQLNPICHLLALLGAHHILHVSRVKIKGHSNTLNAELNPICHLLALLGAHHILDVSRIRVNQVYNPLNAKLNPICHLLALL